jgi:hypothetical protein
MYRCKKRISAVVLVGLLFFVSTWVGSWGAEGQPIGTITAIEGEIWLAHKWDKALCQAMLGDFIYLYDHISTEQGRVQILFEDESLLNLSENSYINIAEYTCTPEENMRSVLIRMLRGKVRGIMGRYFVDPRCKYVISTPTRIINIKVECYNFIVDVSGTGETKLMCVE